MIRGIEPALPARDLNATEAFYRRLGFATPFHDSGYLVVRHGDGRPGCGLHFWPCAEEAVLAASGAYLYVDDADAFHAACLAADAPRTLPPEPKPWGLREGALWDPDGNLLRFGTPLPR
jgi:catechol 2,3-dioxygenase-like lactoylglutathione lyase family enzyme